MTAGDRRRFEARLRHRLDEEYFTLTACRWEGEEPAPEYAMVRIERAGKALGLAISTRVIEAARDPRWLIEHLARQVAQDYRQAKEH